MWVNENIKMGSPSDRLMSTFTPILILPKTSSPSFIVILSREKSLLPTTNQFQSNRSHVFALNNSVLEPLKNVWIKNWWPKQFTEWNFVVVGQIYRQRPPHSRHCPCRSSQTLPPPSVLSKTILPDKFSKQLPKHVTLTCLFLIKLSVFDHNVVDLDQ